MNDFNDYAVKHAGIGSNNLHQYNNMVEGSMTPYILEERKMNVTQMDVFSRLMNDRIIWLSGEVNDAMSSIVSAQLMYLDSTDKKDIKIYLDSPGGSVKSGLTMVDVMNYIASDVSTTNMGMAASMGSILLGNGEKGKRHALPHSRVMLHQVSGGSRGHIEDMKISFQEAEKYNKELFRLLGEYTGKTAKTILKDAQRDLWLNAEESLAYGIIDSVVKTSR